MIKEEFIGEMERLLTLEQAGKDIYHTDFERRKRSRQGCRAVIKDITGYETKPQDYEDPERFDIIRQPVQKALSERVIGYLGENMESILGEIEDSKLAKLALAATSPPESRMSNNAAKAHKKWRKYQEMLQKGAEHYDEIRGEVIELLSKDLDRRLSTDNDPKNKYINEETIKQIKQIILSLASTREMGLAMLSSRVREAEEEFKKIYGDESSQADYARENIRGLAREGDEGKLKAAQAIYLIDRAENQSNKKTDDN